MVSVVIKIVIFLDNDFQAVISTAYAFSLPKTGKISYIFGG